MKWIVPVEGREILLPDVKSKSTHSNYRLTVIVLCATGLLITGSCYGQSGLQKNHESRTEKSSVSASGKVNTMTKPDIIELINNKDWIITEEPISVDPVLTPQLLPLLHNDDPEIRELTLFILNVLPSQEARQGILKALKDEDVNVRSTASRLSLTNYSKEDLQILHNELSTNIDELIRENAALVIGKIGEPKSTKHIREQLEKEVEEHAQDAMHLALTRLKDRENQKLYAERLQHNDVKQRVSALQDFKYVQDSTFYPVISPLLEDQRDGLNVGPSAKKIYIRVCDVAVNVLDEVLKHPFSFEVNESKKYSPEELLEVSKILKNIP